MTVMDSMGDAAAYKEFKYYNISFPAPYVLHVEINRPQKLNAFIEPMWLSFPPLFDRISADLSVRAVILSGAGTQAFTSGLDVQAATQSPTLGPVFAQSPRTSSAASSSSANSSPQDAARVASALREHILTFQSSLTAVASSRKPVICAIQGYCYGLGVDLAVCADVRVCSPTARFAVKEVDIGLAADVGVLSRLPKLVGGGSWAKDVCLTGRVFGAGEARREGLVSHVVDTAATGDSASAKRELLKHALAWAQLVVSKSPVAVQGTKELLDWSWSRSVEDGLRYTAVWNSAMLQSRDVVEAVGAGLQKRKAKFAKL